MNEFMETEKTAGGEKAPDGTPEAPAEEQITDLKARAAKADEHWERLVRLSADFDNFKKRAARERQEAIKLANESLLQKLIPVADNFDMALAASQAPNATAESLQSGISMIHGQFRSVLAEAGLEEINPVNQPFDPNLHEAVAEQATADVPEGHVVQQMRKGYKLREKLIRPATVVVARKPSA